MLNSSSSNSGPSANPPLPRTAWPASRFPLGTVVVIAIILVLPLWFWFFCRIEPGPGKLAILIHKTGRDLPSGQILATDPGQKGIQTNVLAEGRYFRNPYSWDWKYADIQDIPAGKVGVLIRLFGSNLPPGRIIA